MKIRTAFVFLALLAFAGVVALVPGPAFSQAVPVAAPQRADAVMRIRSLTELGRNCLQRAPNVGLKSTKVRNWGVFDVVFDTAPEWIDEMSVTFTVMVQNPKPKDGERPFSLYQVTSIYKDVAMGRDHKVGAVLIPEGMERYGEPVGFAAQFHIGGVVVAEMGNGIGYLKGVDKWWANPQVVDSPTVQKREGYLLERSKTVFAMVEVDSYEVSH